MHPSQLLAALCGLALGALAAPSQAQDVAAAKRMFDQGLSDMEAGHLDKACPAIEASHKLDPRPGTLFTLAECESKQGRLATAAARYEDYLSMYPKLTPEQQRMQGDREKTARAQKAALAPQVPELTLVLAPGAPQNTTVKRDGTELAGPLLGVALPIDPGEHLVTTQAPGGEVTELRVMVGKGEKKQVTLQVKATPSGAASKPSDVPGKTAGPSPDTTPSERRSFVPAIVMGGVALAAVATGVGLIAASQGKRNDTLDFASTVAKSGGTCLGDMPDTRCSQIDSMARQVDTLHNAAIGVYVGAGALVVGTVSYLILSSPKPKKTASQRRGIQVTPVASSKQGGMVVSGRF